MCMNICSWEIRNDCWITMGNLHINVGTLQLTCYYSPIDWKWQIPADNFPHFSVSFHTLWSGSGPHIPPTLARAALLITKSNGFSWLLPPSSTLGHLSHGPPPSSWPTLLYLVLRHCCEHSRTCWEQAIVKSLSEKGGFLLSFAQQVHQDLPDNDKWYLIATIKLEYFLVPYHFSICIM